MDNHFNNDETRRVPLPGSEPPVPEQFTPEQPYSHAVAELVTAL